MAVEVGRCALCDAPVSVDPSQLANDGRRAVRRALEDHLLSHPEEQLLRHYLREALPNVPAAQRPRLVRDVYAHLRRLSGDADTRGVYSLDDVLGSAALYRLWHDAAQCRYPGCRHRA